MLRSFCLLATSVMGVALATPSAVWAQTTPAENSEGVALPYPTKTTPKPTDLGALAARPEATAPISVTVALKMPKLDEAEGLLKAINTPGNSQYHKFLTADEFSARFAPSDADVAKVEASLAKYGLSVEKKGATTLAVTGSVANIERAFSVSLHSYEVAAQGKTPGYTFHSPLSRATVPAEISSSVVGVIGLDSRPSFHPMHKAAPYPQAKAQSNRAQPNLVGYNPPQYWNVNDFVKYYNVKPLYPHVLGGGRTIGILTLADFTKSDAFAYWTAIRASVDNPNRITKILVDGGPGRPSDISGSVETTLDVEQSGGIAVHAKILVYEAPNTGQGFVDLFASAIESNVADVLSISWGQWEWWDNLENNPVTDPIGGETVATTTAVHQLLLRAAIQGQTAFTAAGDSGAYDVNDAQDCPLPECSETLSVDYPASDPAITVAGGTTLPVSLDFCINAACTAPYYQVNVKHERAWGWDYLDGFCAYIGFDPLSCGIFPSGGGGGVSVSFQVPYYQAFLPGVQRSQPNQYFIADGELYYALPSHFAGRNVPDISANADPETGYVIYYTSSTSGFGVLTGWGGTSFVAPQLAGVSALLSNDLGSQRLGLLNYALYSLALSGQAYDGPDAPMKPIPYGDNEFYHGSDGYNPAVGLGTLDVANFDKVLKSLY